MTVAEAVQCVCGLRMRQTPGGGFYCPNCDTVQPQEPKGLQRLKTDRDIRFDMYWLEQMAEYKDNTTPEVIVDEDEGETHE